MVTIVCHVLCLVIGNTIDIVYHKEQILEDIKVCKGECPEAKRRGVFIVGGSWSRE